MNRYLKISFALLFGTGIIYFLQKNFNVIFELKNIDPTQVLVLVILNFINLVILTTIQKVTITPFIPKISNIYLFRLISLGQLSNMIFPSKVGMWIPGFSLKDKFNFSYKIFSFGVILQGIIAVVVMFFVSGNFFIFHSEWRFLSLVYSILFFFLLFYSFKKFGLPKKLRNLLVDEEQSEALLKRKVIGKLFLLHIGILLFYLLRVYFALTFIGVDLSFSQCFEACFMTLLIAGIPFLPGVIGVREVSVASVLYLYGIPVELVTLGLLVERLIQFLLTLMFSKSYVVKKPSTLQ